MERGLLIVFFLVLPVLVGGRSVSVLQTDTAAPQCDLCKAAITELKVIDQDQNTKDLLSIIQTSVCANIPIENCNAWMTGEIAKLHDTMQKMDATEACSSLGACAARVGQLQEGSFQCNFCQFLGDEIKNRILTDATRGKVIAVAEMVCSKIPIPFVSNECSALVKEYGHFFWDLLIGKINFNQLCVKLGLCDLQKRALIENSELFQVIYKGLRDDKGCKACTGGMDIFKTVMKDLLHIAAKELCSPVSFGGCELILDTGIDELFNKLLPMIEPSTVCKQFEACPVTTSDMMTFLPAGAKVGDTTPLCRACHDALGELKKTASDAETGIIASDLAPVICETSWITIPFCDSVIRNLLKRQLESTKTLDVKRTCINLGACSAVSASQWFR